jgi:ribosome-binding factor A
MESTRLKKVARLIERDLGEVFQQMAKNNFRGTLISVTKARVSSDLGVARIYVSIFPTKESNEILKYIQEHTNSVRNELGQRAGKQLRIIPELRFFLDDSLDYEENINRLLRGEGENPIK